MFTIEQRAGIRSQLLERAAKDGRISAAAITGSGASDAEDMWSDIDLAFGLSDGVDVSAAVADWTSYLYSEHAAIHHLDVSFGAWLYRVFLLPGTLQVDLAFVPAADFRPLGSTFRLVFGSAKEAIRIPPPSVESLIGLGWLHALHARTSIARGQVWQAEYMVSGLRDQALALACVQLGLPAVHGRGMDRLPTEVQAKFERALVERLDPEELQRALGVALEAFLDRVRISDEALANQLQATAELLMRSLG